MGCTDSLLQETSTGFLCEAIFAFGSDWWLDQQESQNQLGIFTAQVTDKMVAVFGLRD